MRFFFRIAALCLLANFVCSGQTDPTQKTVARVAKGNKGAVAAGTREAAETGIRILKAGGNAIDAAVAVQLALNVTDANDFCFGGEASWLVYDARRRAVESLIGLGNAPRLATVEYFKSIGGMPAGGKPVTAAVPGAFDAMLTALDRFGTMSFGEVSEPMLQLLDQGTNQWHHNLAKTLRRVIDAERQSPKDRRRGLRLAGDYFYRGPIAHEIDAWSRANGGLLRYADLATHVTRIEEPSVIDYRGYTVYKCGPVTQGPYLLQTLGLLEGFDLKAMGHNSADYIHVVTEALKLSLADRDTYYADPLFVKAPLAELLSPDYASLRRPLIDRQHASLEQRPGDPLHHQPLLPINPKEYGIKPGAINDTTTCLVADKWGNVVAVTPSGWGGVTAGETGVILGSRLRSFNTWLGHPNCIEPGKRPRYTLTPTLVLKGGKPALAISVAGGDMQDQVTLQALLNSIEFELAPAEAVAAPRFGTEHHLGSFDQAAPKLGHLSANAEIGSTTLENLKQRGHKVDLVKQPLAEPVILTIHARTGLKHGAADPRTGHHAVAY